MQSGPEDASSSEQYWWVYPIAIGIVAVIVLLLGLVQA
jgi:hypothetical protein